MHPSETRGLGRVCAIFAAEPQRAKDGARKAAHGCVTFVCMAFIVLNRCAGEQGPEQVPLTRFRTPSSSIAVPIAPPWPFPVRQPPTPKVSRILSLFPSCW